MRLRPQLMMFLALVVLGCAGTRAIAQNTSTAATDPAHFPTKAVHLIEPFGAGGGPDLFARALAPKLEELWGQPVTVENHPGAGATAGPAEVAKAAPDGYTLLLSTNAQAYSAAVLKNLPYNPLKDFVPVVSLTSQPYVLIAGKPAGVATVGELIAAAKARPGELKFGSTGVGTFTHLGALKFNLEAGIQAVHVPPRPTDAITDIVAGTIEGRITYTFAPISITLSPIRDGSLLPLAVSTARRSRLLPEVPTIAEAGLAGFDIPVWYGVWAPAGTPARVVDKLSKDIARVLATPDLLAWIADHGGEPMNMTQPEFARFVQAESENAARIFKDAGLKPQ